jgi:hypothetical protein
VIRATTASPIASPSSPTAMRPQMGNARAQPPHARVVRDRAREHRGIALGR